MSIPEELLTAAAKLRETVKGTTPGPWFRGDCDIYPRWILSASKHDEHGHPEYVIKMTHDEADEVGVSDADWRWMAFAHPGLAEPLAALLERAARRLATARPNHVAALVDDLTLAVARAINGSTPLAPAPAIPQETHR